MSSIFCCCGASWFAFLASLITLGATVEFLYGNLSHYHEASCQILSCEVINETCAIVSETSRLVEQCPIITTYLSLKLSNTTYLGIWSGQETAYNNVCNKSEATCYYHDKNIATSLSLTHHLQVQDALYGIILVSSVAALCLAISIATTVYARTTEEWPHFRRNCCTGYRAID